MNKILIIEDDNDLREGLAFSLSSDDTEVRTASCAKAGMALINNTCFDLVLLDCNLPDGNGFELCTEIRKCSDMPVLMLTARDTEIDEVKALELGADDFMSKPFSLAVLKARINKLIKKKRPDDLMISGNITIDKSICRVTKSGETVELSKIEYQLLNYLVVNEGLVLTKDHILEQVWDCNGSFVDDNTLQVNIRRLRKKIEDDPSQPKHLVTVYGMGYIWKKA